MLTIRMWKQIDYMYSVSTDGLVMNHLTGLLLKQSPCGKKSKHNPTKPRYMKVRLHGKSFPVHRLVAIAFIPNPENLPQVNHIDGVKTHNWVSNLEWVTNKDNIIKAYKNNLIHVNRGEDHHNCTHSRESAIKAIKLLASGKFTYSQITSMTGFSATMLYDIKRRRIWKHESEGYIFPDIIHLPDFSMYYETIDDLILKGYSTRKIRQVYPIENLTSQQWRSLVYNRKKSLKRKGLL